MAQWKNEVRYQQTHLGLPVFDTSVVLLSQNNPLRCSVPWHRDQW
ncbi:hypothetical protein O9993_18690 [Vibrio lentus]|nr:hypothetical protein [Vibrio lentus]